MTRFRDRTGQPGSSTWSGGDFPEGQPDFPVKEWVWNERNGSRYILGGGYGEPPYMFNDPDAQPPFERRANFGFRVAQYPQPVPAGLLGKIEQPMRDYTKERPKGEEAFRLYAGLYGYDKTPLDARTESVAEADR